MKKRNNTILKFEKNTIAILKLTIIKGGRIPTEATKYTMCGGCGIARSTRC